MEIIGVVVKTTYGIGYYNIRVIDLFSAWKIFGRVKGCYCAGLIVTQSYGTSPASILSIGLITSCTSSYGFLPV